MSALPTPHHLVRRTVSAVAAGLICTVGVASLGEARQAESDPVVIGSGPKAVFVGLAPTFGGDPAHGETEESYFARTSRHLPGLSTAAVVDGPWWSGARPSPGPIRHRGKRTTPTSPAPAATCQHPERARAWRCRAGRRLWRSRRWCATSRRGTPRTSLSRSRPRASLRSRRRDRLARPRPSVFLEDHAGPTAQRVVSMGLSWDPVSLMAGGVAASGITRRPRPRRAASRRRRR